MANAAVKLAHATFGETDIASAAICDLSTIDTVRANVTGTTAITSFGPGENMWRIIRFSGVLTLTYSATSLILPTAANIVTAVGDVAMAFSDGDGNWRVISYQRASGAALV